MVIVRLFGRHSLSDIEEVAKYKDDAFRMFALAKREVIDLLKIGGAEVAEYAETEKPGIRLEPVIYQAEIPYKRMTEREIIENRLKLLLVPIERTKKLLRQVEYWCSQETEVLALYLEQFDWQTKECPANLSSSEKTAVNEQIELYAFKRFGQFAALLHLGTYARFCNLLTNIV